ncbi:helix-turn-helix domain-containing protein [Chitinophaga tropicalis]|uniref:Helix-turn-helix domain-containing protein n=1 Tax=Chitinophaga tropicalis TaxID=2683588 RepID=A0A7K1U051_9BACT|nr:AraC family transcriptional regulator [Chitinophaga tropicalis]MVT07747.1 helix-turn-helix domain-containing protein [Chitinophaga tropicalis]
MKISAHDLTCIQQVEELITKNITNDYSISILSQKVGINEDKLKKGFKHVYGHPVFMYLRIKKLERAKSLLEETKLTEAAIAKKVGFKSLPSFIKAFKKKYNQLPNTFRSQ